MHLVVTLQARRRHVKGPGKEHGQRESKNQEKRQQAVGPLGQAQGRSHNLASLHKQPADDDVGSSHLEYITAFEFVD